jgi:nucleotide sugar dehydrogenase
VVGAFDDADGDAVASLYESIDAPVVRADVASAEMVKLASNAFLATKISFINEIANVCEETGADVSLVAEGMGLDRRIGSLFLRPGIGYSGSCLPKDVTALKQLAGNSATTSSFLTAVIEVNELQKRRVVGKLAKHLGSLRGKTIALLGLAFKPNTNDMRDAPSLILAPRLLAEGAVVRGWDPRRSRGGQAGAPRRRAHGDAARRAHRRGRSGDRDGMGRAHRPARVRAAECDADAAHRRRPQPPRSGRGPAAGFVYESIGRAAHDLDALPETEEPETKLRR